MNLKMLVLLVTTDCNLRCRYCYAEAGEKAEYMSWEVAKKALDFVKERSDGFKIEFSGGEPILGFDLVRQVISYTRGWRTSYQLQTNATLITREVARRIRELGIAVGVSLDGLPKFNDPLRPFPDGRGSTVEAIDGISNLAKEGVRVGMTCVLSEENVRGLPGLVELASYLGNVEGISIDVLRPIGRGKGVGEADPILASYFVELALERADELASLGGKRVAFREVERIRYLLDHGLKRRYRCYLDAEAQLVVKPNGDVYPCASLANFPEFRLGNVLDQDLDGRIDDNMRRCRELIAPLPRCLACPWHWLCGGPCPAQIYVQRLTKGDGLVECYVRRTFIGYVTKRRTRDEEPMFQGGRRYEGSRKDQGEGGFRLQA
ncbi:MAG: hypothetical protein DRQ08_09565 [Candidatus Latescibacterota bacterium]|nr:MAG: hypothetical protein DRQ08_09565 [Candidatus Latescibacterota bacterium]